MTIYTNWKQIDGNWVPLKIFVGGKEPDNRRIMDECSHWREVWKRTKPDPDDGRNFVPGRDDRR